MTNYWWQNLFHFWKLYQLSIVFERSYALKYSRPPWSSQYSLSLSLISLIVTPPWFTITENFQNLNMCVWFTFRCGTLLFLFINVNECQKPVCCFSGLKNIQTNWQFLEMHICVNNHMSGSSDELFFVPPLFPQLRNLLCMCGGRYVYGSHQM